MPDSMTCTSDAITQLNRSHAERLQRIKARPLIVLGERVDCACGPAWHRYMGEWGDVIGINHFGASAPQSMLMCEFGFTGENVGKRALTLLERNNA